MALKSIRWLAAKHVVALLQAQELLDGVSVTDSWPGEKHVKPEMIWLDRIDGDTSIPVGTGVGARKARDDIFRLLFKIGVSGRGQSMDQVMTRLMEIRGEVEDVLANDPTLGDFDAVVSAELKPSFETMAHTSEGPVAYCELTIEVHSRLT